MIRTSVFAGIGLMSFAPAMAVAAPTPAESIATYLDRIVRIDDAGPKLNAVIVTAPGIAEAKQEKGALSGRAILIKDNIETRDMPTTAGSLALAGNLTHRDAPLVANLRHAGAVILGKTNLSEWANYRGSFSSSGWSGVGGQTRNPYALDRSPCGSSSGSGAAVAAGLAWAAVGTETDGSITCPASLNGVVGFKPTVGLVSRTYVVPISVSQDTAGPMAHTVEDAALLLNAMAGPDGADPATLKAPAKHVDFTAGLASASLKGVRIGVMREQVGALPSVKALFGKALADLRRAGAILVDIDYHDDGRLGADEGIVLAYEFHKGIDAYLQSLPGSTSGQGLPRDLAALIAFNAAHAPQEMRWYGQELFERALAAKDAGAYEKARAEALTLSRAEGIDRLMRENRVEALIAPTAGPAWPIDPVTGDHFVDIGAGSLAAVAGYPHLTVPMGAVEGLPVGLSFIASRWQDARLLQLGAAYERARTVPLVVPDFMPWPWPPPPGSTTP